MATFEKALLLDGAPVVLFRGAAVLVRPLVRAIFYSPVNGYLLLVPHDGEPVKLASPDMGDGSDGWHVCGPDDDRGTLDSPPEKPAGAIPLGDLGAVFPAGSVEQYPILALHGGAMVYTFTAAGDGVFTLYAWDFQRGGASGVFIPGRWNFDGPGWKYPGGYRERGPWNITVPTFDD